ncbi:hypothetical protein [Lysobacter humi (ex Lee et al. 2017)]
MDTSARLSTRLVLVVVALLLLALVRSAAGTARDGLTIDEPYHYASGVAYVRFGDYRLNPEHPPLAKSWVGLFAPRDTVLPPIPVLKEKRAERRFVQTMTFLDNPADVSQATIRRAMFALNLLLLGALGLAVARLAGGWWAAGMLAFLAVEPTVGAHLPLLMTDLPVALALGLTAAMGAIFARSWSGAGLAGFGVAAGVALASKHSAIAGVVGVGIALLVLALLPGRRRGDATAAPMAPIGRPGRVARLAASAVIAVAVLWSTYGFQYHATPDGRDPFNRPIADKIEDVASPMQRGLLQTADRLHVLPRPYIWGLADTIRAGVEGRGQKEHWLFGTKHRGAPPWFFWPGMLLAKVPLALLFAALAGAVALWRAPLDADRRRLLACMGAMALAYWLALLTSRGTYAGIRHALPLVVALASLAGVLAWRLSLLPRRAWRPAAFVPAALALAMTVREPRLYEYFNELAGGTENAWKGFADEGVDLGQRLPEAAAFVRARTGTTLPVYNRYYYMPEWERAVAFPLRRFASGIDDTNVAGRFEGVFLMGMGATIPDPDYDWDPKKTLANLRLVGRVGTLGIWQGRLDEPRMRAMSLYGDLISHIYEERRPDWTKVAQRCGEILSVAPFHVGCAVERGNALARLHDITGARAAWATARKFLPPDDPTAVRLAQLDASIRDGRLPPGARLVRNPWME